MNSPPGASDRSHADCAGGNDLLTVPTFGIAKSWAECASLAPRVGHNLLRVLQVSVALTGYGGIKRKCLCLRFRPKSSQRQ